jgi:gamma-glutamylputrescine oxidase
MKSSKQEESNTGSTSFWQEAFQETSIPASLSGTVQTDVAILGGGITGISAALWLARAGIPVSVLEARRVAAAASGRNGGFIADGTTELYADAIERHGRERARRMWAFSVANHAYAEQFLQELEEQNWRCDYRRTGSLKLAASEGELATISKSVALMREDGWQASMLEREELPARLQRSYHGGAFFPANGALQPVRFVTGLAQLAQQAGAATYEASPVMTIEQRSGYIELATPQGIMRAQQVILAANAWLPTLGKLLGADWLARCITPTRGQVIATEPLSERILPYPCSANEGYQYWRQLEDRRLIVGGWRNRSFETEARTYDESPYEGIQQHLDDFVHTALDLPDTRIAARWAGIMAFTPDTLPLTGQLPCLPCFYICGGYTGHGNAFAIHAARLVSDLVQGKPNADAELFDPARFVQM